MPMSQDKSKVVEKKKECRTFSEEVQDMFSTLSIYDYLDYRKFLQDVYNHLKQKDAKYSFRYLSQRAGFASSSTFKLVIDGKRNLRDKSIVQIGRAIRLDADQVKYFNHLVKFNQAKSDDEKKIYLEKMGSLRKVDKAIELDQEYNDYISNLLAITIREMVSIPGFFLNAKWIADNVIQTCQSKEIVEAIKLLLSLRLVKQDAQGNLVSSQSRLRTRPEVKCPNLHQMYHSLLGRAQEALVKVPSQERDFSALMISLSKEHISRVKDLIFSFRQELEGMINSLPKDNGAEVYCINLNFFPMTQIEKMKGAGNATS